MSTTCNAELDSVWTSNQTPPGVPLASEPIPGVVRPESDNYPHLARIPHAKLAETLSFQRIEQQGEAAITYLRQRLGGDELGRSTFYEWRSLLAIDPADDWYDEDDLLYLEVFGLYMQRHRSRKCAFKAVQELYRWRKTQDEQQS